MGRENRRWELSFRYFYYFSLEKGSERRRDVWILNLDILFYCYIGIKILYVSVLWFFVLLDVLFGRIMV